MFEEKIISKIGYIETTIPFKFYNQLLQNINSADFTNQEFNYALAGQIETEFKFNPNQIPGGVKKCIQDACAKYVEKFDHNVFFVSQPNKRYNFQILNSWINFQKKTEYNPIHYHTSGDLVFVIWIQIPYELEEERKRSSSVNSNGSLSASCFQFANINNPYTNTMRSIIEIDKTYEGKMIVFHSRLEHTVYPFFTSDDYRISMSGNIKIAFEE